jgi:hypothetical protein
VQLQLRGARPGIPAAPGGGGGGWGWGTAAGWERPEPGQLPRPQALALELAQGRHLLLCNRSAAHLQLGDKQAALQDALDALQSAPADFSRVSMPLPAPLPAFARTRTGPPGASGGYAAAPAWAPVRAGGATAGPVCAQAWVRVIDAHYALGSFAEAAEALAQAQARCPGFRGIPEYKVRVLPAACCMLPAELLPAACRLPPAAC